MLVLDECDQVTKNVQEARYGVSQINFLSRNCYEVFPLFFFHSSPLLVHSGKNFSSWTRKTQTRDFKTSGWKCKSQRREQPTSSWMRSKNHHNVIFYWTIWVCRRKFCFLHSRSRKWVYSTLKWKMPRTLIFSWRNPRQQMPTGYSRHRKSQKNSARSRKTVSYPLPIAMKNFFFIISFLLLSSCTMSQDSWVATDQQATIIWTQQVSGETALPKELHNFWSGFTLTQTESETSITYSGKTVKTWSHTPPEKVPFIWDEACSIAWKGFEKLPPEDQSTGKQWVWNTLTETEKKDCMKEYYQQNIRVEETQNPRFYQIIQTDYEVFTIWIYDITTWSLQKIPAMGSLEVSETSSWILITVDNDRWDTNTRILYRPDFSWILSQEEILK